MVHTASASITPDADELDTIYSKYLVESTLGGKDPLLYLNVNADVAVYTFTAPHLTLEYDTKADLTGFARIDGVIGGGQIRFCTHLGVQFYGPIEGGPREAESFVGTGTWTVAWRGGHILLAVVEHIYSSFTECEVVYLRSYPKQFLVRPPYRSTLGDLGIVVPDSHRFPVPEAVLSTKIGGTHTALAYIVSVPKTVWSIVLNYSVLLKVEKTPGAVWPYQSFYTDVFSGHIPKQPQKSSLGYNRGFRIVFILNASLAAFATLVVVSIAVIKQKNLSRGAEIELKDSHPPVPSDTPSENIQKASQSQWVGGRCQPIDIEFMYSKISIYRPIVGRN
jgi:hypothetical protein